MLRLIQLGGVGGRVIYMEAGSLCQPGLDLGMLVRAVVVHHQMVVQPLGNGLLDLAQEIQELLVPVAWLAIGDHLASGHVTALRTG